MVDMDFQMLTGYIGGCSKTSKSENADCTGKIHHKHRKIQNR